MMTRGKSRYGPSARGTPRVGAVIRGRPLVLALLAVAGLAQAGCQSGPCSPCSKCGGGASPVAWFRGVRERVFHRGAAGGCCGGAPIGMEAPLVEGAPAVVTPAPAAALPAPAESPQTLEPIPQATPGPAPEAAPSSGAKSPNGKAAYEAYRPKTLSSRPRRGLSRGEVPPLEPTPRSAQGTSSDAAFLDNLPPVDVPVETPKSDITPPTPPAARADGGQTPASGAAPKPEEAKAEGVKADGGGDSLPTPVSVAPGLRRFLAVDPRLAGGSLPSPAGLDWLAEKGYRTLLDLREAQEIGPRFIADASRRGLRYVALPLTLKTVDKAHLDSFEFEISHADARPLYFFDDEGQRAGVLWYIHRVAVDKVDHHVARRESEELGLTDDSFRLAATSYLARAKAEASAPAPDDLEPPAAAPAAKDEPGKPSKNGPVGPEKGVTPSARPEASTPAATDPLAGPPVVPHDPTAWRPYAAMVVTGLGVPLAYWSASALPVARSRLRASLPGPRRAAKSLPGAWDA